MSFIIDINTEVPENVHTQIQFGAYYTQLTSDEILKRKINIVLKKTGIEKRYSVLKEFGNNQKIDVENSISTVNFDIDRRMNIYKDEALNLSLKTIHNLTSFEKNRNKITHLITVSCTGMYAPGLDIELIEKLKLPQNTVRNSVNFMGCNAAILAMKQANDICNSTENAMVLIVCIELCTIHFQHDFSDNYIVSNSIFGDGCAAMIISSNKCIETKKQISIEQFESVIIPKSQNEMAWKISKNGFLMYLSNLVPSLISTSIHLIMKNYKVDFDYYLLHPGGKKILDDCKLILKNDFLASYNVLKNYGNMSSPTIIFVLEHFMNNNSIKKNETILLLGFGPGLSVESCKLKYV